MVGEQKEVKGLECPRCGCHHFEVLETRVTAGAIVRRRECRHCGRRVTTREKVVTTRRLGDAETRGS